MFNYLTVYEKARLIGTRAEQISQQAPIQVQTSAINPIEIAEEEFKKGVIPISILRKMPNGKIYKVSIRKKHNN